MIVLQFTHDYHDQPGSYYVPAGFSDPSPYAHEVTKFKSLAAARRHIDHAGLQGVFAVVVPDEEENTK